MLQQIFLFFFGISGGFAVSAGVFALVTALSLLPRMADKTHTGKYMMCYETCVLLGGLSGMALYFLQIHGKNIALPDLLSTFFLLLSGLFSGVFVGTLSISIAENLDVTAVLGRRIRLHHGMGILILSFAIGKTLGALLFFYQKFY